nr:hypothetical protein [Streptomyces adustus]
MSKVLLAARKEALSRLATALGGDRLSDVAMPWAEPHVFGRVASDPAVSRLVDVLAAAGPKALTVIRTARTEVRRLVRLSKPSRRLS